MTTLTCQPIPPTDLPAAFAIHQEYLDSRQSIEEFSVLYHKYPSLYVGCYRARELVGICFGYPFTEKRPESRGVIVLEGIAVKYDDWNQGYGSQLFQYFAEQAKALGGYDRIGVGSAENIETENYYLKNGFVPTHLCIKVAAERSNENFAALGYTFAERRVINGVLNLYVATTVRDKSLQAKLKEQFQASEVIFILEKLL